MAFVFRCTLASARASLHLQSRPRATKRDTHKRRRVFKATACASNSDAFSSFTGANAAPIGADYGEGFEVFDSTQSFAHVDVAALNKALRVTGAQRLRHAMKPDEALGAIFVLEGVLADTRPLGEASWKLLAAEYSFPLPAIMGPRMFDLPPVRVITDVLEWSKDIGTARSLAHRLGQLYTELFVDLSEAQPGVVEWLKSLENTRVPCALVSHMGRGDVRAVLEKMGVNMFFSADVTFEDDMETLAQQFLCAAVKLGRPPDQCIVFDHSPMGIAAAHNCTMKAVAVQGYFKGYQLKQADLTCASLDELTVYNLRRLFANRGSEFMDHMKDKYDKKSTRRNTIATF